MLCKVITANSTNSSSYSINLSIIISTNSSSSYVENHNNDIIIINVGNILLLLS